MRIPKTPDDSDLASHPARQVISVNEGVELRMTTALVGFHPAEEALRIIDEELKTVQERTEILLGQREILGAHLCIVQEQRFAKGKRYLDRLPIELSERILDLIYDSLCRCRHNRSTYNISIQTFDSLSCVSHELRTLAEPYLYRHIVISEFGDPSRRLSDTLIARPALRPLIKTLDLRTGFNAHLDIGLIVLCDSLERLVVADPIHALCAPSTLAELSITSRIRTTSLLPILSRLTALSSLEFEQHPDDASGMKVPRLQELISTSRLDSLAIVARLDLCQPFAVLVSALCGVSNLVIENAHDLLGTELLGIPLEYIITSPAPRMTHLVLNQWRFNAATGPFSRLLTGEPTSGRLGSLRRITFFGQLDPYVSFALPVDIFGLLPPALDCLEFHFYGIASMERDVSATLPSILAAYNHTPSPDRSRRRLARIRSTLSGCAWRTSVQQCTEECAFINVDYSNELPTARQAEAWRYGHPRHHTGYERDKICEDSWRGGATLEETISIYWEDIPEVVEATAQHTAAPVPFSTDDPVSF